MTSKQRPTPTPESRIIEDAFARKVTKKAVVAAALEVSPGLVSQWANGATPVAAHHAPALARILGVSDPGLISAAYRSAAALTNRLSAGGNDTEVIEGELHEIRMAIAVLASVMKEHRPAEARLVATLIRRQVPEHLRRAGLFGKLLAVLDAP